ncbi:MAG: YcbK family protein [Polyangia bacterium]
MDEPTFALERIRKQQQAKPPRAPLRIMIATDPDRPVRTLSLPRALPRWLAIGAAVLVAATVVLACGSWKLNGALGVLERRVHAMVQAADSVALAPSTPVGGTGLLTAGALGPGRTHVLAGPIGRFTVESVNTGETMEVPVNLATGELDAETYRRLRHVMRCQRTGAETPIDPRLLDLLVRIAQRTHQKIQLVSGFRAPMFSLATLSYHTRGMAADIRIPGMTPLMVRDLAESMGVGGIGYYPVSGFVHVDVRDDHVRWIDYGGNRQDREGAEHGPDHAESAETGEPAAESPEAAEDLGAAPR